MSHFPLEINEMRVFIASFIHSANGYNLLISGVRAQIPASARGFPSPQHTRATFPAPLSLPNRPDDLRTYKTMYRFITCFVYFLSPGLEVKPCNGRNLRLLYSRIYPDAGLANNRWSMSHFSLMSVNESFLIDEWQAMDSKEEDPSSPSKTERTVIQASGGKREGSNVYWVLSMNRDLCKRSLSFKLYNHTTNLSDHSIFTQGSIWLDRLGYLP